jgi:YVTN family beta-propeller protein
MTTHPTWCGPGRPAILCWVAGLLLLAVSAEPLSAADDVLQLESKLPLGPVQGRIDHFAIDPSRQLLYVAELGNNSVGVVDLKTGRVVRRIAGLSTPQGVGYVPSSDLLFVANAGDGSVRWFRGADGSAAGKIDLGADADNLHVDAAVSRVYVGYGNGALAVLDGATGKKLGEVALGGHPEGFDLASTSPAIFVNVPSRKAIVVIDRATMRMTATWPTNTSGDNFPLAADDAAGRLFTVFRGPTSVGVFSTVDGSRLANFASCDDADDVFADQKRHRLYVSCGGGFIDVFDTASRSFERVAHIATAAGARTELLVPETDQLFLAVRAVSAEPAAIWVFRPNP